MSTRSTHRTRSYFIATVIAVLALSGCAAREKLELPAPIDIPDINVPDVSAPEIPLPDSIGVGIVDTNDNGGRGQPRGALGQPRQ